MATIATVIMSSMSVKPVALRILGPQTARGFIIALHAQLVAKRTYVASLSLHEACALVALAECVTLFKVPLTHLSSRLRAQSEPTVKSRLELQDALARRIPYMTYDQSG